MIIALPMSLAWRVRLPWKPRLALFGVFSLGGVIVIFAIIRIVFTNTEHRQPEISWLNIWSAIEASVACIVCNLAPFKILFSKRVQNYTSEAYGYRGRSARDGKVPLESLEASMSSRAGNLQTSISAKQGEDQNTLARKDVIVVTEELDRKVMDADQIATVNVGAQKGRSNSIIRTWTGRQSEESVDRLRPITPGVKGFA